MSTNELTIERLKASALAPRKAIQIAVDTTSLVAVCDDGSVWRIFDGWETTGRGWYRMPSIPQD